MSAKRKPRKKKSRPRGGATMLCPCEKEATTRVLRTVRDATRIVRHRQCLSCRQRFETIERRT